MLLMKLLIYYTPFVTKYVLLQLTLFTSLSVSAETIFGEVIIYTHLNLYQHDKNKGMHREFIHLIRKYYFINIYNNVHYTRQNCVITDYGLKADTLSMSNN